MRLKTLTISILLNIMFTGLYAQNIPERLNTYLTNASTDHGMNGNVLIADNGNILYKNAYGYTNFKDKLPNTDASLFPLASISKTFTAIAVLQLKEKGKLRLDDRFSKYFTEFPYPGITIRQLLSHTSGLPDTEDLLDSLVTTHPDKIFTNTDVIPALIIYKKHKQLRFQPGENWGYSSVGYQLLALLVEKISHESFAVYLKKHIFLPAGMASSYLQVSLSQKQNKNRIKTGH